MSVLINKNTKVIVQGFTGQQGTFHATQMIEYGTQVVGGVTPGKGGTTHIDLPVFNTVADAVQSTGANASVIYVPPPYAADAILEAAAAGIKVIVCITEGVPAHDEAKFYNELKAQHPDVQMLGPNCPGIITPGQCNIGITAGHIAKPGGPVGIVSRSGTLTYQALYELQQKDIGVTTCVGIGGDPVPGTSFIDCLAAFEADPETKAVMMIGEIGGSAEEEAAEFVKNHKIQKPMVGFVAGITAPPGRRMGHAGAIISGGKGGAEDKIKKMEESGITVAKSPSIIGKTLFNKLSN